MTAITITTQLLAFPPKQEARPEVRSKLWPLVSSGLQDARHN
jgi:hypothetical protein